MGLDNKIRVAFIPVNTTSILLPVNQGGTSTFKSHYLRNSFCKAIADLDGDSGKDSPLKVSLRICRDSWEKCNYRH